MPDDGAPKLTNPVTNEASYRVAHRDPRPALLQPARWSSTRIIADSRPS